MIAKTCSNPKCVNPRKSKSGFLPLTHFEKRFPGDEIGKSVCKFCMTCSRVKRLSNPKSTVHKDVRYKYHRSKLVESYGLTKEAFENMMSIQRGVCAICGEVCKSGILSIDHDHTTGKVRGLLCRQCNSGLGFFKSDTRGNQLLFKALNYLKGSS
ncbi:Recombination endonuclease VII [uncultured archaeon]|nr:Recombination endonuclease VII [uncultured archaeon]